jgi:hypothetical protein
MKQIYDPARLVGGWKSDIIFLCTFIYNQKIRENIL